MPWRPTSYEPRALETTWVSATGAPIREVWTTATEGRAATCFGLHFRLLGNQAMNLGSLGRRVVAGLVEVEGW
jgi:hypothetical protein